MDVGTGSAPDAASRFPKALRKATSDRPCQRSSGPVAGVIPVRHVARAELDDVDAVVTAQFLALAARHHYILDGAVQGRVRHSAPLGLGQDHREHWNRRTNLV